MSPRISDPAFALMKEYQRLREGLTAEKRAAASLAQAKQRVEAQKLSNDERRALLKRLFAEELQP